MTHPFPGFRTWGLVGLVGGMVLAGVAGRAAPVAYTNPPFSRYEVILERMPFGRPPPPPKPKESAPPPAPETVGPTREEIVFYKTHKLVALTRTDNGIGVGFIDSSQKPPRNYFALVGESVDGYEIVRADFANETVDIRREGELYSLKLGQESAGPPPRDAAGPGTARPSPPPERSGDGEDTSYVERVRRRREALQRKREREAEQARREVESRVERLTGEALEKHLRQLNMELIRAGGEMGPPLPIELTPEEDAQLVEEGVLPPAE